MLEGRHLMNFQPFNVLLIALFWTLVVISFADSPSLLTDTVLDELGAGGGSLVYQTEEVAHPLLSDIAFDSITPQGLPGNAWPFQYLPDRIAVFRGFLTWPLDSEGSIGQTSTDILFRGTPVPWSQVLPAQTTNDHIQRESVILAPRSPSGRGGGVASADACTV